MNKAIKSIVDELLKYAGEEGVAAYGVIMYVNFIFVSAFIGYTMGVAPIISFNTGAQTYGELKNVTKKSLHIVCLASLGMVAAAQLLARPLASVFAGYDEQFLALSIHALRLYALNYAFSGTNIFGSGFFAALNNGKISAFLSALRMLVFQLLSVLIVPVFLQTDGIWLSMPIAEFFTILFTIGCLSRYRKRYHY